MGMTRDQVCLYRAACPVLYTWGSVRYPTYYWTLRITLARLNNKYMEMHVGQYEIPGTGMF